jgi:low affinity Fe/Cu permease
MGTGRHATHRWLHLFNGFAKVSAELVGSPWAFVLATVMVLVWVITGPLFGYSDMWQLIINTGTTVITFLIVFLIQNSQNRDTKAINLKLDELIRSLEGARNRLINLQDRPDEELAELERQLKAMRPGERNSPQSR